MATRRLLPSQSLAALAALVDVPLPLGFRAPSVAAVEADRVRADAQGALVAAGACTADGAVAADLAGALPVLVAPAFTVDIVLRTTAADGDGPVDLGAPARAWTACVAGDATRVVGLLRRDVTPVVELSVSTPADLPAELHRLLDSLPRPEPVVRALSGFDEGEFVRVGAAREQIVPLELIGLVDGMRRTGGRVHDVDRIAELAAVRPDQVRGVLTLLDTTDATLDVRVAAHGGLTTIGELLWYRTPSGWRSLEAAPDVRDPHGRRMARILSVRSEEVVPALAPLVAAALPLRVAS